MLNRRALLNASVLAALGLASSTPVWAQAPDAQSPENTNKKALTLAIALEPNGLDPTVSAASSAGEITLYNVYETLTKINSDASVTPLLAESWNVSSDMKTYTFQLRRDVRFHNGEPFNAQTVKFAFDRAKATNSTNKDKAFFSQLETKVVDDYTVTLTNNDVNPDLLFMLGQATAIIVEPSSAARNNTRPVGTGPYQFGRWNRGASVTLTRWDAYPRATRSHIETATFRFISDPAAQVAALLSGDVDVFQRVSPRSLNQFKNNDRFQVTTSGSQAKTILALNNKRGPLQDVRVRQAISAAIDRHALIEGAGDGLGVPIGSHYVPGAFGYVDTTAINPYDPVKAVALLEEAGIKTPLKLKMTLPPAPYARQGGVIVAAMLKRVGIEVELQNVEWAQWLSNTFQRHNFDMTLISHVEPFDMGNYANPNYYWGYDSPEFRDLWNTIKNTSQPAERSRMLAAAQRMLANDAVNVFLYQPQWVTVAHKNVRGLWRNMPIFVNDLSALRWA